MPPCQQSPPATRHVGTEKAGSDRSSGLLTGGAVEQISKNILDSNYSTGNKHTKAMAPRRGLGRCKSRCSAAATARSRLRATFALAGHAVWLWRRDQAAVAAQQAGGNTIVVKDFQGRRPAKLAVDERHRRGGARRGLDSLSGAGDGTPGHRQAAGAASQRRSGGVSAARHFRFGAVRQGHA